MDDEIFVAVAISVVVEACAKFLQYGESLSFDTRGVTECACLITEVVAKCSDHGPGSLTSTQKTIDQHASADIGCRIDDCMQTGMQGQLTGLVMIEVIDDHTFLQQRVERYAIASQRYIEYDHPVASMRLHTLEQGNLALSTRNQCRSRRLFQPQLMEGADTIGIAIKDIKLLGRR